MVAPVPLSVTAVPAHTVLAVAVDPTVGIALTVMFWVAVLAFPCASVTVQVTTVNPIGYDPGALLVKETTPQLSLNTGNPKIIGLPLQTETAAGAVMVG